MTTTAPVGLTVTTTVDMAGFVELGRSVIGADVASVAVTGTVAVTGLDDTGDEDDDDTGEDDDDTDEDDTDDEDDDDVDVVDVEDVGDGSTGGMVIATSAVVTVPSGAVSSTMTVPIVSGAVKPAGSRSLPCFTSVASNENVTGPDPVQVLLGPTTSQTHVVDPLSGTTGVAVRSIWPAGTALMTRLDVPSTGTEM